MQKFIEEDYYQLDWWYEDCADGNEAFLLVMMRNDVPGM